MTRDEAIQTVWGQVARTLAHDLTTRAPYLYNPLDAPADTHRLIAAAHAVQRIARRREARP